MYQLSIPPGIYLLKQSILGKPFEHYGVGITGLSVPLLDFYRPVVVHRRPEGIQMTDWIPEEWGRLSGARDANAALDRLVLACRDPNYRVLDNNCEQFAREIVTGKRESRQVQGVLFSVALIGLVLWASSDS